MVVLAAGPANEPLASELAEIVDPGSTGRHRSSLTWSASAAIRARAHAARQQGAVQVRFTMNRVRFVLSCAIVRKSGPFMLDQAALDTLRRAQPLPAIRAGRPDTVELTVPIEFDLR
ncbi:energy transducer TonB [Novosphingobium sp. fls2-241-R2A-195]|jgi:protein TonB|uniref:energy transducer TonB n=1 Tax=Novosphingobium sp. fls2-241-R2A-195 TaxID=3040296 RepID=UPI00254A1458|nr:energy transducer TonB [Novosphingobium sp. fls2-241-R2A-195]